MKITQQLKECLSYIAPPISKYDTREKNYMYVYDYMGRRYTEKVTWYTYSHDLTKNVTELYQSDGLIATTYDYSPYGAITAEGTDQPFQYSSEYHDPELALTYYNYRHYNPTDGRWVNRDPIQEGGGFNLYGFVKNSLAWLDSLGLKTVLGYYSDGSKIQNAKYNFDLEVEKNENQECSIIFQINLELVGYDLSNDLHMKIKKETETLMSKELSSLSIAVSSAASGSCCCQSVKVKFRIQPTNNSTISPHTVVHFGPFGSFEPTEECRSNSEHWINPNPRVIMHEILHHVGVYDEYLDKKYYPEKTEEDLPPDHHSSIMGGGTKLYPRHLVRILELANLTELGGCQLSISRKI